jgi:hypothetical protein
MKYIFTVVIQHDIIQYMHGATKSIAVLGCITLPYTVALAYVNHYTSRLTSIILCPETLSVSSSQLKPNIKWKLCPQSWIN